MDRIAVLLTIIVVALLGTIVFLLLSTNPNHDRFNNWLARCQRDGGTVQLTRVGSWSNQYECFKDSKIIDHEE
jgi:hypothetical protein